METQYLIPVLIHVKFRFVISQVGQHVDMLSRGRYRAALHRVRRPALPRISCPFLVRPRHDATVASDLFVQEDLGSVEEISATTMALHFDWEIQYPRLLVSVPLPLDLVLG